MPTITVQRGVKLSAQNALIREAQQQGTFAQVRSKFGRPRIDEAVEIEYDGIPTTILCFPVETENERARTHVFVPRVNSRLRTDGLVVQETRAASANNPTAGHRLIHSVMHLDGRSYFKQLL